MQELEELDFKAEISIKKVDYVTDWDNDVEALLRQITTSEEDVQKALDSGIEWSTWPQPVMVIIGRTASGKRVVLLNTEMRPYFYIPLSEYEPELENDEKITGIEHGYENPDGEHMVRVYTRIPGDVPKIRDGYTHHEADILFPNRFLIDAGIEGSIRIPADHATEYPTQISIDEIEDTECNYPSRVCFCDIEVDDSNGFPEQSLAQEEITSITVYDNYEEDYILMMYHPDTPDITHDTASVEVYDNEYDLIYRFVEYLKNRRFDIITGWNFDDFDMRYIVNRLEYLSELDDSFNLDRSDVSILGSAFDEGYFGAKVKGLAVFDMLRAYKNSKFTESDSYKLEDVAQEELGEGKIADNRDLYEIWQNDPQKFADYNVKDVELVVRLEEEQDLIKFFEEVTDYVGGRLSECVDASKAVDIKILRKVNGLWAVPSGKQADGMDFEGGQVFEPITGVKHNVAVLDLKSLYPMCMKTLNAGVNTKDPNGDLTAPNGISFTTERTAVVVDVIDELLDERQKYKDLRDEQPAGSKLHEIYDRKQAAIKIVMNTLYGVLGWDKFRLADVDVGAAVTSTGREVIKFTERITEELGYNVIYGDTDSVMVELGEDVTQEEALRIGKELESEMNKRYDEFAKNELNAEEHYFEMEFEKLYRRYFQAGRKKRYAGHIVWKEGKEVDDTDIVGFEFRRSDYAKVAKILQEEILSIIVRGGNLQDLHSIVDTTINKIKSEQYDIEALGMPSSIGKNFDSYDNKTQAVKGAEFANEHLDDTIRPGDKPKKYFIKSIGDPDDENEIRAIPPRDGDGNMYVCVSNPSVIPDKWVIDWDIFINKQILKPMKRVLSGTDWNLNEVLTGNRQPRLNDFTFEDRSTEDSKAIKVEDEKIPEELKMDDSEFVEDVEDILDISLDEILNDPDIVDTGGEVTQVDFKEPEGDEYKLKDFM